MIRSLIVEDAPIVRQGIRLLLQEEPDVDVIGEAGDGPDAVAQISKFRPDLVILDIQMPGFDGFEVLERTCNEHPCAVIFITAYSDYTMRAFDANALSYLLKPINPARFREVLQRARTLLGNGRELGVSHTQKNRLPAQPTDLRQPSLEPLEIREQPLSRLVVKRGDRYTLVKTEDIEWISSTGEYATLHTRQSSFLIRITLSELEGRLDKRLFARIHRSTIVNLDRVREIRSRSHGDYDVLMKDGPVLRLSRSYRDFVLMT